MCYNIHVTQQRRIIMVKLLVSTDIKNNTSIFANLSDLNDSELLAQIENVVRHPARVGNVVILPDVHLGYGVPIGCVVATKGAVIPNAVGVDIGCSMSAVKTSLHCDEITEDVLKKIVGGSKEYPGGIVANIPFGTAHNNYKQDHQIFADPQAWFNTTVCCENYESAQFQLGSVGGGNHFIEIQSDTDGNVWFMIHTGSRNLGYKVCNHYNKIAVDLCNKWFHKDVVETSLPFLPQGTDEYEDYLAEMNLCMRFAQANHEVIQDKIKGIIQHIFPSVQFDKALYTMHNFARMENVYGQNLMVHRKGAICAREGDLEIIPGSQGTSSYIVRGLGNPTSMCSASHGSGRKMSRNQARATLTLKEEQEKMKGIIHNMLTEKSLDEAPSAYKDIKSVLKYEKTLVEPVTELRPLAVVKES